MVRVSFIRQPQLHIRILLSYPEKEYGRCLKMQSGTVNRPSHIWNVYTSDLNIWKTTGLYQRVEHSND